MRSNHVTVLPRSSYDTSMTWSSLPPSIRIAACAFTIHAMLLLVDLFAFDAAYALNSHGGWFMPLVRIAAFGLFALTLLRRDPRPWLIGFVVLVAFFIRDVAQLNELFSAPSAPTTQLLLNAALFASVASGVVSLIAPALRRLLARRQRSPSSD